MAEEKQKVKQQTPKTYFINSEQLIDIKTIRREYGRS